MSDDKMMEALRSKYLAIMNDIRTHESPDYRAGKIVDAMRYIMCCAILAGEVDEQHLFKWSDELLQDRHDLTRIPGQS